MKKIIDAIDKAVYGSDLTDITVFMNTEEYTVGISEDGTPIDLIELDDGEMEWSWQMVKSIEDLARHYKNNLPLCDRLIFEGVTPGCLNFRVTVDTNKLKLTALRIESDSNE